MGKEKERITKVINERILNENELLGQLLRDMKAVGKNGSDEERIQMGKAHEERDLAWRRRNSRRRRKR